MVAVDFDLTVFVVLLVTRFNAVDLDIGRALLEMDCIIAFVVGC